MTASEYGIDTKSMRYIELWRHIFFYWRHIFFYRKILKYLNDFQNRNFSVLRLKWTWTMKMKKIRHVSMRHIKIWRHIFFCHSMTKLNPNNRNEAKSDIFRVTCFSFVTKYWNIWMTFIIDIFQFHCRREHTQVKWNKDKRDMWKSDVIFVYLQSSTLFILILKDPVQVPRWPPNFAPIGTVK